ncbi:MAG: hypothetical protein COB67_00505 [SAR324 cluster bacterium]|uniref:Uncharacterized protein n=1 Tax=SAR324 cluster bacterium TaxID=2024889 RepID=A0A2A4TCD1_9DELT|nr:MAG: hypothetical protein COB67_00505 [SAR324 cluster bacterium]
MLQDNIKYFTKEICESMNTEAGCFQAKKTMGRFIQDVVPHGIVVLNGMETVCKYYYVETKGIPLLFMVDNSNERLSEEEALTETKNGNFVDVKNSLSLTYNMKELIEYIAKEVKPISKIRDLEDILIVYMDRTGAVDKVNLNEDESFAAITPLMSKNAGLALNELNKLVI